MRHQEIAALPFLERRKLAPDIILAAIEENPEAKAAAYLVGTWIWIEFEKKPAVEVLAFIKGLGFHWNKDRKAWQHPCGVFAKKSADDPTEKYGVKKI